MTERAPGWSLGVRLAHFRMCAGIICDSCAASIVDCQVLVEPGITNPNSKFHSAREGKGCIAQERLLTLHK